LRNNLIAALFVFALPLGASAGLLSIFSGMFRSAQADETTPPNSQNIALLEAAINTDPNPISNETSELTVVGGTALYPENGPLGGLTENQKNHPSSDQISLYVVRSGDTLSMIAQMFGVSINTIRWSNDLKNQTISPGQTLVILPVSGVRHVVKKGDTIQSIAKLYKADIEEIKSYNDITDDTTLAVGDIAIVPDGELAPAPAATTPSARVKFTTPTKTVSGGFFIRPTTGTRSQGIHGYNAVDIAARTGTPIVAAAGGRVLISRNSGYNGGYGNYVVIQHNNGTQTLYAHMSRTAIAQGSVVEQGELIGYVGSTGKSTGSHLHFEVRGAKNPF
jgi:murein DD-endopeptidase MepM/ murein hydrolase activator NlpD